MAGLNGQAPTLIMDFVKVRPMPMPPRDGIFQSWRDIGRWWAAILFMLGLYALIGWGVYALLT